MKKTVCLTIDEDVVDGIDSERGPVSRSAYVELLLRTALDGAEAIE